MSENKIAEADSTSESTQAIEIDPSQATDADGLAGQLEMMLNPQPETPPASEELEETESVETTESPSDEPSSDEPTEDGETEEVLSQTESEDSTLNFT